MRIPTLSLRAVLNALGVLLAVVLVSAPMISEAQLGNDPSKDREAVRAQKAKVATEVDAQRATVAQVEKALADLRANVAGQEALLAEAQRAAAEAEEAAAQATKAVEAKTAEIEVLRDKVRAYAVQVFVRPPADDALAALDSDNPGEAATKRALLEVQHSNEADVLDQLTAAEEDLEVQRELATAAAERARKKQAEAADRLTELTAARDQQAAYAAQVEARLERSLAEAAHLEERDAQLSAQIQAEQARLAELARQAAAAQRVSRRSSGGAVSSPTLASVSCPGGGSITVAKSIAGNLQSLLNAASSDGVQMCGWGWRSSARQEELRTINGCPDVYSSPPSSCDTPTARPGQSMHEQGLAVDFTQGGQTLSSSSSGYSWLKSNASSYGFHNLPSEPWHWSTNGQ